MLINFNKNMDSSLFIGKLIAILYLSVGIGFFFNKEHYKEVINNFCCSPAFFYFGGFLALIVGYLIITFHNIWSMNWYVVITVIGWIAFTEGIMLLIFPRVMLCITKGLFKKNKLMNFAIISALIVGLYFAYFTFIKN